MSFVGRVSDPLRTRGLVMDTSSDNSKDNQERAPRTGVTAVGDDQPADSSELGTSDSDPSGGNDSPGVAGHYSGPYAPCNRSRGAEDLLFSTEFSDQLRALGVKGGAHSMKVGTVLLDLIRRASSQSSSSKVVGAAPSKFDGINPPHDVQSWLTRTLRILKVNKVRREERVAAAASYLVDTAHNYWEAKEKLMSPAQRADWEVFSDTLTLVYGRANQELLAEQELQGLSQVKCGGIEKMVKLFTTLCSRLTTNPMAEGEQIRRVQV